MIALVVNMHACVTVSHLGGWYLKVDPAPAPVTKLAFVLWQAHMQAFFMGLLFFVAGYFAHHSLERRGPRGFIWERARRLGLPSLLYMLLIHPLIVFVLRGQPHGPSQPTLGTLYAQYLVSGDVLSGNGPLWFALALLLFCAVLAGWRVLSNQQPPSIGARRAPPSAGALALFAGGVALGTFLVRLVQPLGTDILNFQLCFFTQYIAAFVAGVCAGRQGWLTSLATSRHAKLAGYGAIIAGPLLLALIALIGGPVPETGPNPYGGGWSLRAFAFAAWEQTIGPCIALGLLALFSRRFNASTPFTTWLSKRSFGVYVFHAPVLVSLTPWVTAITVEPVVRMLLLTGAGLVASYVAAEIAGRLPGLRAIL